MSKYEPITLAATAAPEQPTEPEFRRYPLDMTCAQCGHEFGYHNGMNCVSFTSTFEPQPGFATPQPAEQTEQAAIRDAALEKAATMCVMDAQTIRLHAGELTGRELQAVQAVLAFVEYRISLLKTAP